MNKTIVAAVLAAAFGTGAMAESLNICVEGAYPPFSYTEASGEIAGFDVDIANALCAEMGNECAILKTEWDGIIPALLEGKCDAIIASMSITADRMEVIDFTVKYYNTPARFVGREGMTLESLDGAVVGVQRGTVHQDFLEGEFPNVQTRLYGSQDELNLDLVAGRIDALIADSVAMDESFLKTEAGAGFAFFGGSYADPQYFGEGAGIGIRKGEEALRDGFSAAIAAIRASGEYAAINAAYFDFDVYGD